jgi:glycosyltransferase involved in cell wall biosynthesis
MLERSANSTHQSFSPEEKVLLITGPSSQISEIFTRNLLFILKRLTRISFIGSMSDGEALEGVEGHHDVPRPLPNSNIVFRALNYLLIQVHIARSAIGEKDAGAAIFFLSDNLVLSMVLMKLIRPRMKIISFPGGRTSEAYRRKKSLLAYPFALLEKASYMLSDSIILYSPNIVSEWHMKNYGKKVLVAHEHFLDLGLFSIRESYASRPQIVGYVGRLSEEKGVLEFVHAIPSVLKERNDVSFLIVGNGQLSDRVKGYLDEQGLSGRVTLIPWVPHDLLPAYLNRLKLLVLPSYTEGLPNIMIEALACGTPFLATPVGAVPDIVKDGVTGYLTPDNTPAHISEHILRALNSSATGAVIMNGRRLVEREFSFEAAVERYGRILNQILIM